MSRILAARVSIWGMYDCHLFHKIKGKTVDEIITAWLDHNAVRQPALVDGRTVEDMGPSMLCPAIVLDANDQELRRVGDMVFTDYKCRSKAMDPAKLECYREALSNDPDIPRLLKESA